MVLHITIFDSGFALGVLNEHLTGLLLLIAFKTAMGIYHLDIDEKATSKNKSPIINEKVKKKMMPF